jgi:hypothetical protein
MIPPQTFDLASDGAPPGRFGSRRPRRISLDDEAIRIDYSPTRARILRWDDAKFQFALLDFRESVHNRPPWVRAPKQFEFRFRPEFGLSAFSIPEGAFVALSQAARSQGLKLGPSITGGGIPAGTRVYHFARRAPRWWLRVRG